MTGVLTLGGSASRQLPGGAARNVTYVNTSEQPATATRTVSFAVNDGLGDERHRHPQHLGRVGG